MEIKELKHTPEATLRRLPRYLHLLNRLKDEGVNDVSSTTIATEMGLDPTLVRKDIEYTEIKGKPKTGFNVTDLIREIREFLNWNNSTDAFLVGAGSLGTAMLGYAGFKKYGLNFLAAFDNDITKIGSTIHGVQVFPIAKLPELILRMHINIGVLTVPAFVAQNVADLMVEGGIKAIWNFAPIQIKVPENIVVENAQLTQSLAVISRKLRETLQ